MLTQIKVGVQLPIILASQDLARMFPEVGS